MTIWIARHANREDFANPDWATTADRPHDPGLSVDGKEQAHQLARRIATLDIDRVVASPFRRTVQTAHHAADAADTSVLLEPGLGEWENPDWFDTKPETLPFSTLSDRHERLARHDPCSQPSFPESKHDAMTRLGATAQCLADRYADETLLLMGHGITVIGVLRGLVGEDVSDPGCPLACLTRVVRRDGDWTIRLRNDTSHLENGARAADRRV
jgi:Fructose-2,6-bisphosphatase